MTEDGGPMTEDEGQKSDGVTVKWTGNRARMMTCSLSFSFSFSLRMIVPVAVRGHRWTRGQVENEND